ncbi:MAG: 3-deoxy-manno-octulosonate cytidylyltransferase [Phycisphaerales bacterium]|nr:3-deoxy-manno-octulosonate cytidylyltransferase [Phycisphaerales bacterium]
MPVIAVIPARFASTRLPGKPLLRETGKYLIEHVYDRVRLCKNIDRCIIATDDLRIADAARSFDAEVAMTRPDHASGTDRIAEVIRAMSGRDDDVVVNIQGDEPEIEPLDLDRLVVRLRNSPDAVTATLAAPFASDADPRDPNCVKVVTNARSLALYFSRSLIPYPRDADARATWLLHLGVYAYRRAFLLSIASLPQSRLEQIEKLEQLRVLENGYAMAVEVVERAVPGVDTPDDYARFADRWRSMERSKPPPP